MKVKSISHFAAMPLAVLMFSGPAAAQQSTDVVPGEPASQSLPPVEVVTKKKPKAKAAAKRKARPKSSVAAAPSAPAPAPEPQLSPEEIAAAQNAAARTEWMTTGNPAPTQALGNLPPAYAGGQVATGGGLGMLGNRSTMDTPFSQTSYTAKTIQDQQARSVGDVLANDPSVRSVLGSSAGFGFDVYHIRGFYYESGDSALNGLYGLAPQYSVYPNFVERIEVLKGPSALLSGMPPAGAIGGSINLITKQAPDFPITQVTTTYQSDGVLGTHLDFARRYGPNNEWGVRFNGGYRSGDTNIDHQHEELGNATLNLDYRGDRLRVSADIGYQSQDLDSPLRFISIPAALGVVPPPPKAGSNYSAPWMYWRPTDTFAMIQGEYDITDNITAYGAIGWHDSKIDYLYASPTVISPTGDWRGLLGDGKDTFETWSGIAGVRTTFDTGPVNHLLNVSYSSIERDYTSGIDVPTSLFFVSNLYNPVSQPKPTVPFVPGLSTITGTSLSSVGVSDTLSILNDRVQFTAGVRRQTAGVDNDSTNFLLATHEVSSTEDSVWSPAYALLIKPWQHVSLYANYIEGIKTGRTVPSLTGDYANAGQVFPPYQTEQKEIGVKFDFGRISTTVAAFDIMQPAFIDVERTNPTPPPSTLTSLELDGEQRNRGVEVNVFGELTPTVRVLGGVAYIDGRLEKTGDTNNDGIIGDNNGNRAQGVAKWNVNLGAEWDTPFIPGLTLTGRMIYTSSAYINAANTLKIPDWTRFDVGARYTFDSPWNGKPITLRFAVENVANDNYYAGSYSADGVVSLGAPRTYLLSSTFNF